MTPRFEFADISSNQLPANVNLAEYHAEGHRLLAVKMGGGPGDEWPNGDPYFDHWFGEAHALGMWRWAYYYARFDSSSHSGYDQAMNALEIYKRHIPVRGDRIVLDFETMLTNPSHNNDQARQFVSTLQRHGAICVVYSSPGFLASYGNPHFGCDIWLADYAQTMWNPGNYKIVAWQHTDGQVGKAPYGARGMGHCDMSSLTKTGYLKQLLKGTR